MDVDDCNVDCDFLDVVDLSFFAAEAAAASELCSGDDDGEEEDDASPPRMPHKCCESRNELCSTCLSGGGLIAAAAVNTDAADRIKVIERIASFANMCRISPNPRSSRSVAA